MSGSALRARSSRSAIAACAILVLVVPACSPRGGDPRLARVSQRQRLELSSELRRRLAKHPNDVAACFRLGTLQLELGVPQAALGNLSRAVNNAADPRLRLFLGHAHYALGDFGKAYDQYRDAAAAGLDISGVLEGTRRRIGAEVKSPSAMPGLGGVVELVAPEERRALLELAGELERLGGLSTVDLRAVDLVLFSAMAQSSSWREELGGDSLARYCRESGRGVEIDVGSWTRLAGGGPGFAPSPSGDAAAGAGEADGAARATDGARGADAGVELGAARKAFHRDMEELGWIAAGDLDDLHVEAAPGASGERVVVSAGGRRLEVAPRPEDILAHLDDVLASAGSKRRFRAFEERDGRLLVLCLTPEQLDLVASRRR